MTLEHAARAAGKFPFLIMFGRAGFSAPNDLAEKLFSGMTPALAAIHDPAGPVFEGGLRTASGLGAGEYLGLPHATDCVGDLPNTWELVAAGWALASLDPTRQADDGAGITRGIIGLVNKGQPRKPEDWGALRAWAWGAGRGRDSSADPAVDVKHLGIEGVSRYGKAALVTMAFDQRFAMVLVARPARWGNAASPQFRRGRREPHRVGEYYWMAGNFIKHGPSLMPHSQASNPATFPSSRPPPKTPPPHIHQLLEFQRGLIRKWLDHRSKL